MSNALAKVSELANPPRIGLQVSVPLGAAGQGRSSIADGRAEQRRVSVV